MSLLKEKLGLELPIFQAPIGGFTNPQLVAAVANAGCGGMHAFSWTSRFDIETAMAATHELTSGVFGANLVLEWDQQKRFDKLVECGCKLVSFFWGDPSAYIKKAQAAGMTTMMTVGSSEEARHAADIGIDILVAQGWEAGGHVWGRVTTMALVPAIVKALPNVPVVAAGGIASGQAMVAALALGAEAVWMGTRFVASVEATAHSGYKDKLLQANEASTAYGYMFDGGWPDAAHRVLHSKTVDAAESNKDKDRAVIGRTPNGNEINRFDDIPPAAGMTGAWQETALYAGQSVGQIDSIKSVTEIIRDLMNEARTAASPLPAILG